LTQPPDPPAPEPPPEADGSLDQWIEEVVDTLPPLTEEQRDLLALIFRKHRS
jgi:hypothetical protein